MSEQTANNQSETNNKQTTKQTTLTLNNQDQNQNQDRNQQQQQTEDQNQNQDQDQQQEQTQNQNIDQQQQAQADQVKQAVTQLTQEQLIEQQNKRISDLEKTIKEQSTILKSNLIKPLVDTKKFKEKDLKDKSYVELKAMNDALDVLKDYKQSNQGQKITAINRNPNESDSDKKNKSGFRRYVPGKQEFH